jgi:hypothetical protein
MKYFKVIDDLLPKPYLRDLQDHFLSDYCNWSFNGSLTGDESEEVLGSFGFAIKLHWNGYFTGGYESTLTKALVFSAQEKVEEIINQPMEIVRARGDMTVFNPLNHRHELHTDFQYEHMTAIFYLNTSDGNTILLDREGKSILHEVEPVENRLLIFDGLMQHTGHSPSKNKCRVLINMNFMTPKLVHELNEKYGINGR